MRSTLGRYSYFLFLRLDYIIFIGFTETGNISRHIKKTNISPAWRTVGLLVPVYGIVLVYEQFRDIRDIAQGAGYKKLSIGWLLAGYLASNIFSLVLSGLSTIFLYYI